MSSFTKLKLTLVMMAAKLRVRGRKTTVDFGAPSPHSQRWDERERAMRAQQRFARPAARGLNVRVLALIGALFAVSLVADLLLPPVIGTAVGLVLLGGTLAYFFYVKQNRSSSPPR